MANRILDVQMEIRRLDPLEAEIWIAVTAERVGPATEIRGRMIGPKCEITTTIEVAYPLRPTAHRRGEGPDYAARVVIPEPSLWEPQHPFVYDAVIELWEEGECRDQRKITGFRLVQPGTKK